MSDFKKCPNCSAHLELVNEVLNLTHGKVHFRSWLCPGCGVRVETRRIGNEPEETLLVSQPRTVIDARLAEEDARRAEGHRQFLSVGGRRNVSTLP